MGLSDLWIKEGNFLNWTITLSVIDHLSFLFSSSGSWLSGSSWDWSFFFGCWFSRKLDVLNEMEFVSLHCDVLTEILISVHSSGEKFLIRRTACNTRNSRVGTSSLELNEASSRWVSSNREWRL